MTEMSTKDWPLVSVLMTSYNREKYIGEAISSVLASTYTNFELIIVDDLSRDKTVSIAREYASKDSRVKIYVNEQNLGDYPNRNKAASYAKGKYIKYVDADDMIYPWGLEIMVDSMEKFQAAGYGLCSFDPDAHKIFPFQLSQAEAYMQHYSGKGIFSRAPLSSIIRRDAFEAVGKFSPIRMSGDYEMWHKLSLHYPVVIMQQGVVWYRRHDSQEMNRHKEFEFGYSKISLDYLQHPSCPLQKEMSISYQKTMTRYTSRRLISLLLKGEISRFNAERSKLQLSVPKIIKNIL